MEDKEKFKATVKKELERLERTISMYKDMTNPIAPNDAIGRVSRMDAIKQ
ncbi:hypothetical protein [Flagellimonas ruestringensis]|nr:hypothetical protein [Allomuricauda ruestringensis]